MQIKKNSGYAYIMMLIMAASLSLLAATAGVILYSRVIRAEKEKELIFRGMEYKRALKSYYEAGTARKELPYNLSDLLIDSRFSDKKHIRRLYKDPITNGEWALILNEEGRITGVASKSKQKPYKQKGFPEEIKSFEDSENYSTWIFSFSN